MCVCVRPSEMCRPTLIQWVQSGAYRRGHGYFLFLVLFLLHPLHLRGLSLLARVDELGGCGVVEGLETHQRLTIRTFFTQLKLKTLSMV